MLTSILILLAVGIIVCEVTLWFFFRRRIEGLHLHLASTTTKRIFTLPRIRMLAILHTLFLLLASVFSLLLSW